MGRQSGQYIPFIIRFVWTCGVHLVSLNRSIVNGLRDEDIESVSPRRISVNSDYSVIPPEGEDQLFFKEHARSNSKGSNISFLARKRNNPAANRPETKVCGLFVSLLPKIKKYFVGLL